MFLGANTADGLVHFYDQIIDMYNLKKLYIIKGASGGGKSTFIRNFATSFKPDYCITWLFCSGDPKSLDGAIIEDIGLAIIDGTKPHAIETKYPGLIDEIVDLGNFLIPEKLTVSKEAIDKINQKKQVLYKAAFAKLDAARAEHKKLESYFTEAMDFDAVNALCNTLIIEAKLATGAINRKSFFEKDTK